MRKTLMNKKMLVMFFVTLSFLAGANIALSSELNSNNNNEEEVKRVNPLSIISKDAFGLVLQKLDESHLISVARACKGFREIANRVIEKKLQERVQQIPKLFGDVLGANIQEALKGKPLSFYARTLKSLTDDPEFTRNLFDRHQDQLMGMKLAPLNLFFLMCHSQKLMARGMMGYDIIRMVNVLSKVPLDEREEFLIQAKKILSDLPRAFEVICTIEELAQVPLVDRGDFVDYVQGCLKEKRYSCFEKAELMKEMRTYELYKGNIYQPIIMEQGINLNVYDHKKKGCVLQ